MHACDKKGDKKGYSNTFNEICLFLVTKVLRAEQLEDDVLCFGLWLVMLCVARTLLDVENF